MSKENIRRNQTDNHYTQTLRKALSEVIGKNAFKFLFKRKKLSLLFEVSLKFRRKRDNANKNHAIRSNVGSSSR